MKGRQIPTWISYLITGVLAVGAAIWQRIRDDQLIRETGEAVGDEIVTGMLEAAERQSEEEET